MYSRLCLLHVKEVQYRSGLAVDDSKLIQLVQVKLQQNVEMLAHRLDTAIGTLRAHHDIYLAQVRIRSDFWVVFSADFNM